METKSCSQCKIIKSLDQFYSKVSSRDGRKSECIECSKKAVKAFLETPEGKVYYKKSMLPSEAATARRKKYEASPKGKAKQKRSRSSLKGRFTNLKGAAKHRDIEMNLSYEEFCFIVKDLCFYCNGYFGPVITGSGLDRVDPLKGYIVNNVVSCCRICNLIKSDFLSQQETLAAVKAIISIREANQQDKIEEYNVTEISNKEKVI